MATTSQAQVIVIMVPFPAQSHLNQFLDLSNLVLSYNIPVHYITSDIHIRQVKFRQINVLHQSEFTNIHFHGHPIHFENTPPNPNSSTKFPSHMQASFEASMQLREPVAALMHQLSTTSRRVIIIHDPMVTSVIQDCVSVPNVEPYAFQTISAFTLFSYYYESLVNPFPIEADILPKALPSMQGCFTKEITDFGDYQLGFTKFDVGELYNTCRIMEGTYLDLIPNIEHKRNKKQWAIGPLNKKVSTPSNHKCLDWLEKQEPNSVLYVSFGSTTSMSDQQIKELAFGLEESKVNFIWVVRYADKGDIFAKEDKRTEIELPGGFERRVKGMGMVVRDWAPQIEILGHPSTGGFMSHCGWSSCTESISRGVPIAAWPMHSDQPRNAALLSEVLGVGFLVQDWAERDKIVMSTSITEAVRKLMASKQGEDMRRKAKELGGEVRQAVSQGGISYAELESFIAHISR